VLSAVRVAVIAVILAGNVNGNDVHENGNMTEIEICTALAAEAASGESMAGMGCYQTEAEALQVASNMCCNGTCCSGAHTMGASCPWAPGTTHEKCSSANMLALSNEPATSVEDASGLCASVYMMYESREIATEASKQLGCTTAHMMGDMWMPGESMEVGCGPCDSSSIGGHTMAMAFSSNSIVGEILFKTWKGDTPGKYTGSIIATLIMAFLHEGIKHSLRPYVVRQLRGEDAPKKPTRLSQAHAADSALYLVQHCLGYFLMLIAMVYNVGLFIAVIVGAAAGYFCFAAPTDGKSPVKEEDCCD